MNASKFTLISVSSLFGVFFYSVNVFATTSASIIAPVLAVPLIFLGLCALMLNRQASFSRSQLAFLVSMGGFISLLWVNLVLRAPSEWRMVVAVTYQFGVMASLCILATVVSVKSFYSLLLGGLTLILSGLLLGGGMAGFRFGTLYGAAVNQLGGYLALCFGMALWLAAARQSLKGQAFTAHLVAFAAFVLFGVVMTGSRQAFLLVLVWGAMLFSLGKTKWVLVCGVVVTGFVVWVAADLYLLTRLESLVLLARTGDVGGERSIPTRLAILAYGATAWLKAPLFGRGIRAFENESGFGFYAHNNYIELLYNFGISGLVLYYLPLVISTTVAIRELRVPQPGRIWYALVLGLSSFLWVQDLFIVSYFRYTTWTALALLVFAWRRATDSVFGSSAMRQYSAVSTS